MAEQTLTYKVVKGYPQPQKDLYKVYVNTCTYNQAPYIVDCLNGVAMQQTDFPFLHHVVDDHSTDGEPEVIMQWINENCKMSEAVRYDSELTETIKVAHKDNPNLPLVVDFLKENLYGNPRKMEVMRPWQEVCKYEALCEGDDYWIYPMKLQKQVDLLEDNNDCMLCYHAFDVTFTDDFTGLRNMPKFCDVKEAYSFIDVVKGYPFQTATVVYRRQLTDSVLFKKAMALLSYSKVLFMVAAQEGRLCGFNEKWAVYRKNNGGISNVIDKGDYAIERIEKYTEMAELFSPKERRIMHNVYICYLIWEAYVLTPFTDKFFLRLVMREARKSPSTALKLLGRYLKRQLK